MQNQNPNERALKVYPKYRSLTYNKFAIVPEIRLCGKWLQDAGFSTGQSVIVTHEQNKITITISKT